MLSRPVGELIVSFFVVISGGRNCFTPSRAGSCIRALKNGVRRFGSGNFMFDLLAGPGNSGFVRSYPRIQFAVGEKIVAVKKIFKIVLFICLLSTFFQLKFAVANTDKTKTSPLMTNLLNNNFLIDNEGCLYLHYNGALFCNYNEAGDGWSRIKKDLKSIAIDPEHNDKYYIITSANKVQKKSAEKGEYVTVMNGLPNLEFNTIAINPHDTDEIYVGTKKGVYLTRDAGFNWEHLGLEQNIKTFIISPEKKSNFIALTDRGLYSLCLSGLAVHPDR